MIETAIDVCPVCGYPDDFHRTDCSTVELCDPTEIMDEDQNSCSKCLIPSPAVAEETDGTDA